MKSKKNSIWNQLHKYLSPADIQALGENPIFDYLQTTYGKPEESTVQEDLTEFIFKIHDRKVRFWQQDSTGVIIGVGGGQALLETPCPTIGLVAIIELPSTATVSLFGVLLNGVRGLAAAIAQATAAATAQAFFLATPFAQSSALCALVCGGPQCSCVPVPTITAVNSVNVNRALFLPISVTVNLTVRTNVLCM